MVERNRIPEQIDAALHGISPEHYPKSIRKLVHSLEQSGHSVWAVGGCIRDFLLKRAPKDIDIVCSAPPDQIKKIFKQKGHIIGRRFRLVHVITDDGIVEVSTLRSAESNDQAFDDSDRVVETTGRIAIDNCYGTRLEDDVWRRDFTANALYYCFKTNTIIDFSGGVKDILAKRLTFIGDCEQRIKEDPLRLLRAVRFHAKLGLTLSNDIDEAVNNPAMHALLSLIPSARLMDETFKLFQKGHAKASFKALQHTRLMDALFPELLDSLAQSTEMQHLVQATMCNSDARIQTGKKLNPGFLFACLLWPSIWQRYEASKQNKPFPKMQEAVRATLSKQQQTMRIPQRWQVIAKDAWFAQLRMSNLTQRSINSLSKHAKLRLYYDFLDLRAEVSSDPELKIQAEWWALYLKNTQKAIQQLAR